MILWNAHFAAFAPFRLEICLKPVFCSAASQHPRSAGNRPRRRLKRPPRVPSPRRRFQQTYVWMYPLLAGAKALKSVLELRQDWKRVLASLVAGGKVSDHFLTRLNGTLAVDSFHQVLHRVGKKQFHLVGSRSELQGGVLVLSCSPDRSFPRRGKSELSPSLCQHGLVRCQNPT